jgi:RecB family endonuclease NucS
VPLRTLSSILWLERRLAVRAAACGSAVADRFALRAAELDRAVVVQSLIDVLDLDDDVTLRELAAELPPPWTEVFDDHHAALVARGPDVLPRSLVEFLR